MNVREEIDWEREFKIQTLLNATKVTYSIIGDYKIKWLNAGQILHGQYIDYIETTPETKITRINQCK